MRKILSGILVSFVFALTAMVVAGNVEASANTDLRHAYEPVVVTETSEMKARIDNFSTERQSRLVCVEAWNNSTGARTHLGCLTINLDPHMGGQYWAQEFNAPTYLLSSGSYTVAYNYQDSAGGWHEIMSIHKTVQRGHYVAR